MKKVLHLLNLAAASDSQIFNQKKELVVNDTATWMADKQIQELPVTNISMPGIHHSASYSFWNGDTGRFVTSDMDIHTALEKGVRYFDSRPTPYGGSITEYHVNSYGASYNSLLRQFHDFFTGYNSMVDFGEYPSVAQFTTHDTRRNRENYVMITYSSNRIMELSDSNTLIRSEIAVKSEQLYYKIGHLHSSTNQIEWMSQGPYDYGTNPDFAFDANHEYFLEVHQSASLRHYGELYYSVGKLDKRDIEPRFDRLNTGNYSSFGKKPTVSFLKSDDQSSSFLEVHLSDLD